MNSENMINQHSQSHTERPRKKVRIAPVAIANNQPPTIGVGFELSEADKAKMSTISSREGPTSTSSFTSSSTFSSFSSAAPGLTPSVRETSPVVALPTPLTTTSSKLTKPTMLVPDASSSSCVPSAVAPSITMTKPQIEQPVKQLHEEGQEYMCHANKVIRFWFPSSADELNAILSNKSVIHNDLHPSYTHQLFGDDETIIGFKDLSIDLIYSASTFHLLYREQYSDRLVSIGQTASKDDIVNQLRDALPDGWTRDIETFRCDHFNDNQSNNNMEPPGEVVLEYVSKNGESVEVRRSVPYEDVRARETHERVETMSMYFIDGATYADLTDHRWSIYTAYQKKNKALIGYMTCFTFENPFRTNRSKALRVCQLLIMPHYQRQGHGKRLLQLAHDEVIRFNMYELTVEDPNHAFSRMRDNMNLKKCVNENYFHLDDLSWGLSGERKKKIHEIMSVTGGQIIKCYEVLKLHSLDQANNSQISSSSSSNSNSSSSSVKEELKKFRLKVKRRLWNAHKAELKKIDDKDVRIQALEILWKEVANGYRVIYANCFAGASEAKF
jgi:histone acetyltransferase 1